MKIVFFLFLLFLLTTGCETPAEKKERGNPITRHAEEREYTLSPPMHQMKTPYLWENSYVGKHHRITKEFFRCRGSSLNPSRIEKNSVGEQVKIHDCGGTDNHSLPTVNEEERIYPILMTLLNFIQEQTQKKVVVTCGHRCPAHNTYADSSVYNSTSKHMIGAEVDFYVEGMEDTPEEIVELLLSYYRKDKDEKQRVFHRYTKGETNVSTPPWYNEEVFIKLFTAEEGRDFDNRHPYPYIAIQVRKDRQTGERVNYSWPKAHRSYLRW